MLTKNILGIVPLTLMAAFAGACSDNDSDNNTTAIDSLISAIDTNDDLVVTADEWYAAFPARDLNHDGVLDPVEFSFNGVGFASADANHDGVISKYEWDVTLSVWDTNRDAVLVPLEFQPYL